MKLLAAMLFVLTFIAFTLVLGPEQAQAEHPAANLTLSAENASWHEIQRTIIAKEKSSWDLAIKGEQAAYRALHAPNFFTVSSQGVTDRSHSEASALDPRVHFDHYTLSGFVVNFVGDRAVLVTYCVKAAGSDHGKSFVMDSYATSLWVEQNGEWLNAFYQATPVTPQ